MPKKPKPLEYTGPWLCPKCAKDAMKHGPSFKHEYDQNFTGPIADNQLEGKVRCICRACNYKTPWVMFGPNFKRDIRLAERRAKKFFDEEEGG